MAAERRGASIRRLLLAVNAAVLLVPVAAVALFRIYESHLVRETEQRLISESVLIGEMWREAWLAELGITPAEAPRIQPAHAVDGRFFPIEPVIDLNERVQPPAPASTRTVTDRGGPKWRAGERIKPLLDRAKLVNLSGARVLDAEGCVVASSGDQLGECLDHLPEVRAALEGRYAAVARQRISDEPPPPLASISRRGRVRVFTATPILADGEVVAVVRMSRTGLDPLKALWLERRPLLGALVMCLALTLAISLFLSWRISRPVRAITRAAEAIARGERRPLSPGGTVPAEVFALSRALDTMTTQLSDRAAYIAEFAANVSHELKTPLTGLRGAAELLREGWREMDDGQRARFLANMDADAERMERLVTRLLHLARIQSAPDAARRVEVRPFLEGLAARHPERVRLAVSDAPAAIEINPEHLESAVGNLLDNALRHGGDAPVEMTARRAEGGRLEVTVRDHGPGVPEAIRERLFERFFTTERDAGGTGLGLAIVRAVAETRGGAVRFETGPDGTVFTLVV